MAERKNCTLCFHYDVCYAVGSWTERAETCAKYAPDVAEVKHGEWLYSRVHNILHCSECGEIPDCFEPPYCPNCGAKMDGGSDEE